MGGQRWAVLRAPRGLGPGSRDFAGGVRSEDAPLSEEVGLPSAITGWHRCSPLAGKGAEERVTLSRLLI